MSASRSATDRAPESTRGLLRPAALSAALVLLVLAGPSRALSEWTQLGPEGGDVYVLEASPVQSGLIFAGLAEGGVFRSTDGGATWEPARDGIEEAVFDLAADPADPATVYAGTSLGVLVSHDGGASWTPSNGGLPEARPLLVDAVAVAPSAPRTLYAGTSRGVFRSVDAGATWSPVRRGLASGTVRALVVDPSRPNTVYVSLEPSGVYKTTDGGAHWSFSGNGLGSGLPGSRPVALAFAPDDPSTLYALAEHAAYTGVWISTDAGASWQPTGADLRDVGGERRPWRPRDLAVLSGDPPELVAGGRFGILRSTDGGVTWSRSTAGVSGQETLALAALPLAPGAVLAGFRTDGVFRSGDAGASWRPSSGGLVARPLSLGAATGPGTYGLVIDPRGSGRLYALGRAGNLFASADWGATWQGLQERFDPGAGGGGIRTVQDLWLDPTRPRILFSTVLFAPHGGEPSRELLFRSTDAGETWAPVGVGLPAVEGPPGATLGALHWDPRGRTESSGPLSLRIGETAYRSADDGATWSVWFDRLPAPLDRLAPTPDPDTLLAWDEVPGDDPCVGGFCPPPPLVTVLHESVDGGETWTELDVFVQSPGQGSRRVFVDLRDPSVFYTVRDGDVDRSVDGATTFTLFATTPLEPLGARPEEGRAAPEAADPVEPGVRYRGRFDGLERSLDGGASWHPFADGILATIQVRAVVLPARGPRVLFASTQAGVWARSLDGDAYPPESVLPPGEPITTPELPGFRFWARIVPAGGEPVPTRREPACLPETLCVSGALPGRSEVFIRIVGPKPNGFLWPTLVKLTTSAVDVWIERIETGRLRHYRLEGATPGHDVLPGLFDRNGFPE